jgi:hypothetical protein
MTKFLRWLFAPFIIWGLCAAQPVAITRAFNLPANDPYSLAVVAPFVPGNPNVNYFPDWNNPNGKEVVDMSTLTGTTIVIIVLGQSNTTNVTPALYVPTNRTGVINFNISDGGFYRAASGGGAIDPLLGCSGDVDYGLPNKWPNGNWIGQLADQLISAGKATNVVIVPIGVGGSFAADWAVGGSNNPRIGVAHARMVVAGLTPNAIIYGQGESDNGATSQVNYTASGNSMIATLRSFWPSTGIPILINTESYINTLTDANVTNAQAALVNHGNGVWAGANADALVGNVCGAGANTNCRQSDNTHWSVAGAYSIAAAEVTALHATGVSPF